jgi:hypothetical protein
MLTKARMKLNIKRLYAADGQAVRELLKLASLLCKATQSAEQEGEVRTGMAVGAELAPAGASERTAVSPGGRRG